MSNESFFLKVTKLEEYLNHCDSSFELELSNEQIDHAIHKIETLESLIQNAIQPSLKLIN